MFYGIVLDGIKKKPSTYPPACICVLFSSHNNERRKWYENNNSGIQSFKVIWCAACHQES
ncbi:hypothetical protein DWX31_16145 [Hungatella hathewayi]|uniref:Uncharacterized protein n=1 Tax=Hungatella hathewayi TaxID=154046 RepID=A0A3E3DK30_9FIRM|nr:hypothetical protein DWX31_16145 [Hungatella hathewayi]